MNSDGKILKEKVIEGAVSNVIQYLSQFKGTVQVCYEASTGYGYLYDELKKLGFQVKVAHPGELRLIFRSKKKNDRVDARKLSKLLYLEEVPEVYVPEISVRDWRKLIAFRQKLVGQAVGVKNQIRGLFYHHGLEMMPKLWSKTGWQWLENYQWPTSESQLICQVLMGQLSHLKQQIAAIEKQLNSIVQKHPLTSWLMTIPGIGPRTAEAIVAWIDDPKRFQSASKVAAYFGLVPSEYSSAGKPHFGHISKQGPGLIRGLLMQATWKAISKSKTIRAYWERIQREDKDRKKIAVVATAHYLIRVMWAMMRDQKPFQEKEEKAHEKQNPIIQAQTA